MEVLDVNTPFSLQGVSDYSIISIVVTDQEPKKEESMTKPPKSVTSAKSSKSARLGRSDGKDSSLVSRVSTSKEKQGNAKNGNEKKNDRGDFNMTLYNVRDMKNVFVATKDIPVKFVFKYFLYGELGRAPTTTELTEYIIHRKDSPSSPLPLNKTLTQCNLRDGDILKRMILS